MINPVLTLIKTSLLCIIVSCATEPVANKSQCHTLRGEEYEDCRLRERQKELRERRRILDERRRLMIDRGQPDR